MNQMKPHYRLHVIHTQVGPAYSVSIESTRQGKRWRTPYYRESEMRRVFWAVRHDQFVYLLEA